MAYLPPLREVELVSRRLESRGIHSNHSNDKIMENINSPEKTTTPNPTATSTQTGISKRILIRKPQNIPPMGVNSGIFLDVNVLPEDLGPDQKRRQLLKLDVQLQALDVHGKPFVVSKFYNLLARGLKVLNQDLRDWCGQDLIACYDEELVADHFLGQPVRVSVHNRQQGKQWFTTITGFHPVEAAVEQHQSVA